MYQVIACIAMGVLTGVIKQSVAQEAIFSKTIGYGNVIPGAHKNTGYLWATQDLVTHIHVQYANSLAIVPLCIRADTGLTCMTILAV